MRIKEFYLTEANVYKKLDTNLKRAIRIALMQDGTLPLNMIAALKRNPSDEDATKFFSDLLDDMLANTQYGNVSGDGKYDMWLTRQYANGLVDYEDMSGEGADSLGLFRALSNRRMLRPEHSDINKFKTLQQLKNVIRNKYRAEIARCKDEEKLKQLKKTKKDLVLINDENYFVAIPFDYGACYYFNNAVGVSATYCTGSSTTSWFSTYAKDGPIIDVINKKNMNELTGKYQIHAPTRQIKSATQDSSTSNDRTFAELYPGLLERIGEAMLQNADKINEMSKEIVNDYGNKVLTQGYDVAKAVNQLKNTFPLSWNGKAPDAEEPEQETQPANEQTGVRRTDDHDEWRRIVDEVGRGRVQGRYDIQEAQDERNNIHDVAVARDYGTVFASFRHGRYPDGSPRGIINMNGQDLGVNFSR